MSRNKPERAGGKGRVSPWSEPELPSKKEFIAKDTALLPLEGNTGFEERIKKALILALYLGELISQKYFLGAPGTQRLCHVLCEGQGKSQAPGESSKSLQEQAGRAQGSGDAACREGRTQGTGERA